MLALKILLCVLAFISVYFCRKTFLDTDTPEPRKVLISVGCFFGFSIALWLTVYFTNYNYLYYAKIVLFATICLYIVFRHERLDILLIGIVITIIVVFATMICNMKNCEQPTITTSTTYILSVNDKFDVAGSVSGSMFYFSGSIDEQLVYYYYYKDETGKIVPGHIPADLTDIIPMESGDELPRVVEITETPCFMDYNTDPPEHQLYDRSQSTRYELYIPAEAAPKEFVFDLN